MDIDAITPNLLSQTFHAWQQKQCLPEVWQAAQWTDYARDSAPAEKELLLRRQLTHVVAERLDFCRQFEGCVKETTAPDSRQILLSNLQADFCRGNDELEAWSALYHRFIVSPTFSVEELAACANLDVRSFRRHVNNGLHLLTNLLREAEMRRHLGAHLHLRQHLPPPDYAHLFGAKSTIERILQLLTAPDGPSFVSIEGMGGIGKTALAQETALGIAANDAMAGILWISARHERVDRHGNLLALADAARSLDDVVSRLVHQLGQERLAGLPVAEKLAGLQPIFSASPYLVIVDNLETLIDSQDLLPALYPLSGPSRFLLTSRHSLRDYAFVHTLSVSPLSLADSHKLIESELERRSRAGRLGAAEMHQLYDAIGGVPLALKLVAAQLQHLPLAHVVNALKQSNYYVSENVFTYIYYRTWQLLDESSKSLLLFLSTLSPDGEDATWIRWMSDLSEQQFNQALARLLDYSLLEVTGSLQDPLYRLHRLTTTFLRSDLLINWQVKERIDGASLFDSG